MLNKPWAIITATVEADGAFNCMSNMRANTELLGILDSYDVDALEGTYKGVPQGVSFLVHGIEEKVALDLAAQFRQESILTENGLIYVDGRPPVARDKTRDEIGPEAREEDFFSTFLSTGESFSLGLKWENNCD